MKKFNKILVAIDFSDVSASALAVAHDLAKRLEAKLDIVHTVTIKATELAMEAGTGDTENYLGKDLARETAELEQFVQQHISNDIEIEFHVHSGDPIVGINQTAEATGADMIIMGTHGRTGLQHLLMGSVAESTLRASSVPVMCIRS